MRREKEPAPEPLGPGERARLEAVEGVVFDIQRYSLHDGPGLRTNVFFKGCSLRCAWCANPESQEQRPELALFAHRCMSCGQFAEACPAIWEAQGSNGMADYSARAAVCPVAAIRWLGERRTAGDIMREVLRDAPFYEDGGGMTLTGGEASLQPRLAEALLRLAKEECLATALETCGHVGWPVLERLLPYLDLVLFDLKHLDSDIHHTFTGVGNELILANLRRLAAGPVPVIVRVPLIPGFNATAESLAAMADFVADLEGGIQALDLLPYHTLGKTKYKALNRPYPWEGYPLLDEAEVEALVRVAAARGLKVSVGG